MQIQNDSLSALLYFTQFWWKTIKYGSGCSFDTGTSFKSCWQLNVLKFCPLFLLRERVPDFWAGNIDFNKF